MHTESILALEVCTAGSGDGKWNLAISQEFLRDCQVSLMEMNTERFWKANGICYEKGTNGNLPGL